MVPKPNRKIIGTEAKKKEDTPYMVAIIPVLVEAFQQTVARLS